MDQKEITIPKISPNVIESVRFVSQDGRLINQRQYTHSLQGNNIEDSTDDDGCLKEKLFPSGTGKATLKNS
ncbi:hypothetical protein FJY84_02825 [Candidatus Bathyarchaeota archaeon]|nr:hypothetical protein [Candidatus Bathyarchaeota archaeon]